jgi:DHA1 family bicyclomycin/chloramphenicol resistance-like MFS transporter
MNQDSRASGEHAAVSTIADRPPAEFVALIALLTSLVALSIDAMLPALGTIATDLGAGDPNARQFVVLLFFLGLGGGQLLFGPLSDRIGRKPAILAGLAIYSLGALLCLTASSFAMLLAGRAIQGVGASGPRIAAMAMVRDGQAGAAMARVMSLVMSVFIIVPVIAPALGQAVLLVASWRMIFLIFLVIALIAAVWLWLRQAETLPVERRRPLTVASLAGAAREVLTHRVSMGYTLAAGCLFGAMVGYLGSSQQVFGELYGQGDLFALWFAVVAGAMGLASATNARLVMRLGMHRLVRLALRTLILLAMAFLALCLLTGGRPPFPVFIVYMLFAFFCKGMLFGNLNALAMEPMGRIAGMAASVIGSFTSLIAVGVGGLIAQRYDGTLTPLVAGFVGCGLVALLAAEWIARIGAQMPAGKRH